MGFDVTLYFIILYTFTKFNENRTVYRFDISNSNLWICHNENHYCRRFMERLPGRPR